MEMRGPRPAQKNVEMRKLRLAQNNPGREDVEMRKLRLAQNNRGLRPAQNSPSSQHFLPMSRREMDALGWTELDILLVSGDAYVDHPSFGIPLLGRLLESHGYRVGIVAQPRWDKPDDFTVMGRPRLFCGISAGCLDSMLCHYTAFRKKRHDDAYTPGGQAGARPNRACLVYTSLARAAFPGLFIALGGIEASLRRFAHYDFWSDSLRRSLLLDSKADILMYGMGEHSILEVAQALAEGKPTTGIPGTVRLSATAEDGELLPSYEEIQADHKLLLPATLAVEAAVHRRTGRLAQAHGNRYVISEPPSPILTTAELDALYRLPFRREQHPSYREPIPALDMVKWSVTAVRGCGGGCSFCSLALHQGRHLASRSQESILEEVRELTRLPGWKGTISDIGGPTANLWGAHCRIDGQGCRRQSCLSPAICPQLQLAQKQYLDLLRAVKRVPGVRHVGIGSGLRHDAALKEPEFIEGLVSEFVSGQLKLAPEHSIPKVLSLMRKSDFSCFERFLEKFRAVNQRHGLEQYVTPYVMSAFPGCTAEDMRKSAEWFLHQGWHLRQSQCFIPTPGTVATAMFFGHIGLDGKPIYVATSDREREDQHALLFGGQRPHPKGRDGRREGREGRASMSSVALAKEDARPRRP